MVYDYFFGRGRGSFNKPTNKDRKMSGGLESGLRATRRWEAYRRFLLGVLNYLSKSRRNFSAVRKLLHAEHAHAWVSGSHSFPWTFRFLEGNGDELLKEALKKLVSQDEKEWTLLLYEIMRDADLDSEAFRRISPFRYQMLVLLDYGRGFFSFDEGVKKFVNSLVRHKGHFVNDGQQYLLTFPPINSDLVRVLVVREE
jgi:hypothetical protein